MSAILPVLGGALINGLAFSSSGYLFLLIDQDRVDKKAIRRDKAILSSKTRRLRGLAGEQKDSIISKSTLRSSLRRAHIS